MTVEEKKPLASGAHEKMQYSVNHFSFNESRWFVVLIFVMIFSKHKNE